VDDLKVQTEERGQVLLIRLVGQMSPPDVPEVMRELATGLGSRRQHAVVCDLSELAVTMSDWVLTVFPAALRQVGGWPAYSLRLAAPCRTLARRLCQLRMHRYLPVHPTVSDALCQAQLDAGIEPHELFLEPDPIVLRNLRRTVRDLWPHPRGHGRDEAELVTDELAANVIQHVRRPFSVALAFLPTYALVAVTDPSRQEPVPRQAHQDASRGRGLRVVAQLSQDWGVRLVHGEGKTVWATLPAIGPATLSTVPRTRLGVG
jgi:hypothetical protein